MDARVGDAQAVDLEDESFDGVLLHLLLSVVPDPDAVVAEGRGFSRLSARSRSTISS
ncbi:MAG: methyltransferase domain-containing protein [Halobacteriales archaeon]